MLKTFVLAFLGVVVSSVLIAQPSATLTVSTLGQDSPIKKQVAWYVTPAKTISDDTLSPAAFFAFPGLVRLSRDSTYWVRFDIRNDLPTAQKTHILTPSANDNVTCYVSFDEFRTTQTFKIGADVSIWKVAYQYSNCLLPIDLKPGQQASFLLKIQNSYQPSGSPDLRILSYDGVKNQFWNDYANAFNGVYISVLILGAVLAIFLFVVFLYITTRDPLYLYYGLYLGGVALYFSLKTDSLFFIGYWFYGFPALINILNEPIQMMYTALYIRFSIGLLNMSMYDPGLSRFLSRFWKWLLLYGLLMLVVLSVFWQRELQQTLLAVDRVILLIFNAVMLARIIQKNRSPLLPYFLIGNVFFISGVVISTLGSLFLLPPAFTEHLFPINYFQLGVIGEIMCFSFALGYNVRLLERERTKNQRAYINQLHVNQEITENSNRELQEKLSERTREVMAMSEAYQAEKEAFLRSEFEFQLGEMEMQALRAQMNPHFIFNSLNTIRYFVLNNENEKASDYLGKFSRLLRMVLQNSRENTISLSEELEALRLYLDIESRRFGDSFRYEILVPADMDTDGILVPPLLLQPFAENAIWHGLLHSDEPKKLLSVRISEEPDYCLFVIEDNGIGREKAREMNSRSAQVKKSFGMQITNKRVELFNKNFSSQIRISVRDVVRPDGEIGGTSVEITYQLPD
ncbi:histidine kinase [Arundinibacter roseus]|uniref:Sensor protein lytS n=1 Tax=Arundinibacter roseus TaxID=2070510 RepID=A0A4R4JVE2_9BACT|nr:histidine kinase [Arundinibacter roseus]TDB58668.1 hypothetical protein EZE20_22880 [Arundinibacter roseus]